MPNRIMRTRCMMGNYQRFFGKDASNLPIDSIDRAELEIRQIISDLEQLETDLRFLLIMLKAQRHG